MKNLVVKSILALGASGVMLMAQSSNPQRTRPSSEPQTSQGTTQGSDSQMVSKVREAIANDQTAGTMAHNVHVTAKNGMVTLKGKVNSEQERDAIVSDAKKVAGDSNVKDDITVSKSK